MDKISGIIPASNRVKAVEAPEAPASSKASAAPAPARAEAAAPTPVQDRMTLSKEVEKARETGEAPEAPEAPKTYKPTPPQSAKLKAIDDLNAKFFSGAKSAAREPTESPLVEEISINMENMHELPMGPQAQPGSHGLRAS